MPTKISKQTYAKRLRRNQTAGEKALWWLMLLGYRRQRITYGYIPDFYAPLWRVAIEVQGSVHETRAVKKRDKTKRRHLRARGVYIIYLSNEYAINWPLLFLAEVILTGALWHSWVITRWATQQLGRKLFK